MKNDEKMAQIRAVEDKYGLILFRMGLTHLIDVGARHLTEENVAETVKQIETEGKEDEVKGIKRIMTVEFQCDIVRCAAELAAFSIWDLIRYIKKYVVAK